LGFGIAECIIFQLENINPKSYMKLHLVSSTIRLDARGQRRRSYETSFDLELFSVEVNAWWEWFPTTIIDVCPTN
jgi:hypothetical protein